MILGLVIWCFTNSNWCHWSSVKWSIINLTFSSTNAKKAQKYIHFTDYAVSVTRHYQTNKYKCYLSICHLNLNIRICWLLVIGVMLPHIWICCFDKCLWPKAHRLYKINFVSPLRMSQIFEFVGLIRAWGRKLRYYISFYASWSSHERSTSARDRLGRGCGIYCCFLLLFFNDISWI